LRINGNAHFSHPPHLFSWCGPGMSGAGAAGDSVRRAVPVDQFRPMTQRIAFVAGSLPLGGSTTLLLNLCPELIRRNVPCAVFCGDGVHQMKQDFEDRGIPVFTHDFTRIFEDRVADTLTAIDAFRPTIVVATTGKYSFEVLRYYPTSVLRVAMVQTDHASHYSELSHYADHLDAVVGVSRVIKARLDSMRVFSRARKIHIPYGVMMPDASAPSSNPAGVRVLYLGRLSNEQKRVFLFQKILRDLYARKTDFTWTIAGDGPDAAQLRQSLLPLDNEKRVLFAGPVGYSDIPRLFREHDIFLLCSDYEGLPLSLLEGMGHGLIPVVTDIESGIREVVTPGNGFLIPPDAPDGYAAAIHRLSRSRDEMATLSRNAREAVMSGYSSEIMADRWELLAGTNPHGTGAGVRLAKPAILPPLTARHPFRFRFPLRNIRRLWRPARHLFMRRGKA